MFPWIHAVSFTSLLICFKILYTLVWVLCVSCSKFVTNLSQGYKGQWCVILQPVLPKSHPHLLAVHPVLTDEEMTTESLRYNCFNRNGRNAIPKQAGPEAKGSNPTTGLTLFRAHNPFRGNFNHWQVPQKDTGQILFKWRHGYEKKNSIGKVRIRAITLWWLSRSWFVFQKEQYIHIVVVAATAVLHVTGSYIKYWVLLNSPFMRHLCRR